MVLLCGFGIAVCFEAQGMPTWLGIDGYCSLQCTESNIEFSLMAHPQQFIG